MRFVEALSRSVGTRTSRTVNAPAGAWFGCTVTWACAAAGTAKAATAVAAAILRYMMELLLWCAREMDRDDGPVGGAPRTARPRHGPGGPRPASEQPRRRPPRGAMRSGGRGSITTCVW